MKKAVLIVVAVLLVAYVAAMTIPFDPEERRAGTRLGGPLAAEQDTDWSFRSLGRKRIFVETATWYGIPHSVTTNSWVDAGALYIPCNNCATKRWPRNVARDPDVRLKVDGEIYARRAVRITDDQERRRLLGVLGATETPPHRWVFRMDPRAM